MRLIAKSFRHHLRHYSTLLLLYKINPIRKKHWELGIGHWALGTCTERMRVHLVELSLAQPLQELYWALSIGKEKGGVLKCLNFEF
jgi:hypothetical protein